MYYHLQISTIIIKKNTTHQQTKKLSTQCNMIQRNRAISHTRAPTFTKSLDKSKGAENMVSALQSRVALFVAFTIFIGVALLSLDSKNEEKRRLSSSNQLLGQGTLLVNSRQKLAAALAYNFIYVDCMMYGQKEIRSQKTIYILKFPQNPKEQIKQK